VDLRTDIFGVAAIADPTDVLPGFDTNTRLDTTFDTPTLAIVCADGVVVEMYVPALPAVIVPKNQRAAPSGVHRVFAGPVHKTYISVSYSDDGGHLGGEDVLALMKPFASSRPKRSGKVVFALHRENEFIVDGLTDFARSGTIRECDHQPNGDGD